MFILLSIERVPRNDLKIVIVCKKKKKVLPAYCRKILLFSHVWGFVLDWSGESHELLQAKEVDTVNAQLNFGDALCCEVMLGTAAFISSSVPSLGPGTQAA